MIHINSFDLLRAMMKLEINNNFIIKYFEFMKGEWKILRINFYYNLKLYTLQYVGISLILIKSF